MDLFRCQNVELTRLQRALKKQMQETYVGNKPFIGELISRVDKDGTTRDAVWESVSESDRMCEALLTGARWGIQLPRDFYRRLETAKHEMEGRLYGPYRQRAKEVCVVLHTVSFYSNVCSGEDATGNQFSQWDQSARSIHQHG